MRIHRVNCLLDIIITILVLLLTSGSLQAQTELHQAAKSGNIAEITRLLKKGGNVNARDSEKETPLEKAIVADKPQAVRLLVENGADVNAADDDGVTPLMYAVSAGFLVYESKGYNPAGSSLGKGQYTPKDHQVEIVKYLIEKGADIKARSANGGNAFIMAAEKGYVQILRYLVDKGADVNGRREDGSTALFIASFFGYTEVVKILLENRADVNAVLTQGPGKGQSPLLLASGQGHTEIVKILLSKGADPNLKDINGNTALSVAKKQDIAKLLKSAGKREATK